MAAGPSASQASFAQALVVHRIWSRSVQVEIMLMHGAVCLPNLIK